MKRITSSAIVRSLLNLCRAGTCGTIHPVAAKCNSGRRPVGRFDMSRLPRMIGLTALAIFLVWEVGSRSVIAYLAGSAPETAARLRPQEPAALLNLAERELNRPITPDGDADLADKRATRDQRIRTWTESVLLSDPLSAKALRMLGQLADEESNKEIALKFMLASARISLQESLAVYWAMQDSVEKNDYKIALHYADALLRTRPALMSYVWPTLAKMAEKSEARDAVKELLYDNPPWRPQFFESLVTNISDVRIPLDLLLSLRDSARPVSAAELQPYLSFLIEHRFYDLAYYTWLQLLPPDQLASVGPLFNGSFEFAPSGLPFDWTITYGSGVSIDVVPRGEKPGEHALFIEFEHGRVDYRSVMQMTMLTPGSYWFSGKYKGALVGPRGLKWRIVCAGAEDQSIGGSEMIIGTMPLWNDVRFQFAVPEANCRAQHVRLDLEARMESERLVAGSVWFDELQIVRSDDPQSK